MTAATLFTLRPLERRTPAAALEGGFRVHLSSKELKALSLSVGDLCRLTTTNGACGFAVASLFQETNPANKPIAKVTELLRETYGFPLTERVIIEKVTGVSKPAEVISITLSDPAQPLAGYESVAEFEHWALRALDSVEMLHPNCSFEVQRKDDGESFSRGSKVRAVITSIEPPPDANVRVISNSFKSRLILSNAQVTEKAETHIERLIQVDTDGIGGLSKQFDIINECLTPLTHGAFVNLSNGSFIERSILIHGPEGTGKSLILERLAGAGWRQVIKLDSSWLSSNAKSVGKAISDTFELARRNEPSVILIDQLDTLVKKSETLCTSLKEELAKSDASRVFSAAAAQRYYDLDPVLREAFDRTTEILAPNVKQREEILRGILGKERTAEDVNYESLAKRTHGFVGRNLAKLCRLAIAHHIRIEFKACEVAKRSSFREAMDSKNVVAQDDFDAVIDEVPPSVLQDSVLEVPKVKWTDIAGLDHVKEIVESIVIQPLLHPELEQNYPAFSPQKGVLLYGPPGCAKTLIAQAIATESNQNFLAVKGSELIKMYVGESERAIRGVFRRARAARPCIIFFDEIDSIGKSREKTHDSGLNVVTTLLNEMDGIEALKGVYIIGATNRPDILDSALIRNGRFDQLVHIGLPNLEARRQVFEIHLRRMPVAEDVDLSTLAARTEGSSGADIKGLCAVATVAAKNDYLKTQDGQIRMHHFEKALNKHIPRTAEADAARFEKWEPGQPLFLD